MKNCHTYPSQFLKDTYKMLDAHYAHKRLATDNWFQTKNKYLNNLKPIDVADDPMNCGKIYLAAGKMIYGDNFKIIEIGE